MKKNKPLSNRCFSNRVQQSKWLLLRRVHKHQHFKVVRIDSPTPQRDVLGAWAVCSPDTAARFSATALYYAVELHKALGVPIGLINSSVGGTTVEQWTDTATLEATGVPGMSTAGNRELYMAFELGESKWKLAFTDGRRQVRLVNMTSRDVERLKAEETDRPEVAQRALYHLFKLVRPS